ncbi:MAG: exopolysaccharide Pel transporter PelG [Gammaproteobacteria bacterium]|nr:exopolysaccharide Pel transporter PelG [Gammaproteobacteria bacterium]
MAGIGFTLSRILRRDSLASVITAYSTAMMISSMPWIISIVSILILGLVLSVTSAYHVTVMAFQSSITYLVAGSLITSGFAQNSFSRYVADQLFLNRSATVIPNFHGMILLVSLISGLLSFLLILFFFPMQSVMFRLMFMGSFVVLSNIWMVINLLTGLKDYTVIIKSFFVSYGLIIGLAFLFRHHGLDGLMTAYFIGQVLLIIVLMAGVYKQYPTHRFIDFHFLKKDKLYKTLMVSGLFFNLAVWVDKFVFWYTPETSYNIIGPLRGSLFYDAPIFIAYLTAAPGMGVFLLLIETNFSDYYMRFHEAIREGKSLRHIQVMRDQMISHAYNVIYSIVKIQVIIIIIVFQLGGKILAMIHISQIYRNLLFVDVIGTSLQVMFLAILNLLYYMDRRVEALILTTLFLVLNLCFSLLSVHMGPFYYGFGFTVALFFVCTYGMSLLDKEFYNFEYKSIMLRE